jgi:hypothetical protein
MQPTPDSDEFRQLLQRLFTLFAARTDAYAVGRPRPTDPSKFAYYKQDSAYTVDTWEQHARGHEHRAR